MRLVSELYGGQNPARVKVEIPPALLYRAMVFGDRLKKHYAAGGSPRSRAVSGNSGTEKDVRRLGHGKAGEVAVALYFRLDPLTAVKWDWHFADDGADIISPGQLRIDVKTSFPHYRLIWPNSENHLYAEKRFDLIAAVSLTEDGKSCEVEGWISKAEFFARKRVADGGNGLEVDTWYMEKRELLPIDALRDKRSLAALAIKIGKSAEHVLGRWP